MHDLRLVYGEKRPEAAFASLLRRYVPDLTDRSVAGVFARTGITWPTGKTVLWHDVWNLCSWIANGMNVLKPEVQVPSSWERLLGE